MPTRSATCYIETPKATCSETAIEKSRAQAAKILGGRSGLTASGASASGVTWHRQWNEIDKPKKKATRK